MNKCNIFATLNKNSMREHFIKNWLSFIKNISKFTEIELKENSGDGLTENKAVSISTCGNHTYEECIDLLFHWFSVSSQVKFKIDIIMYSITYDTNKKALIDEVTVVLEDGDYIDLYIDTTSLKIGKIFK